MLVVEVFTLGGMQDRCKVRPLKGNTQCTVAKKYPHIGINTFRKFAQQEGYILVALKHKDGFEVAKVAGTAEIETGKRQCLEY